MRVPKASSISFSKRPILSCMVKKQNTKQKTAAILYELDRNDIKDQKEVLSSPYTVDIAPYFFNNSLRYENGKFYLLRDEASKEIINSAKVSKHFHTNQNNEIEKYSVIDEFSQNPNYINGAEPTLAHIAKQASDSYDDGIISAIRQEDLPEINYHRTGFTKNRLGDWVMTENRYIY